MKKLSSDIFLKTIILFTAVFVLFFIVSYALSRYFILSLNSDQMQDTQLLLGMFNTVWLQILLVLFVLLIASYFILRVIRKRVYDDVETLSSHIYEISENKNYNHPLKIQHYFEFLNIAVSLKNITKRLVQKDKKSSKK